MAECVHGAGCARFAPGARSCVSATVVSAGDERSASVRCVVRDPIVSNDLRFTTIYGPAG